MEKIILKVTMEHEFTIQDICDLMVTALEGGINYWCRKAEKKLNSDGTYFGVAEEDQNKVDYASDLIAYNGTLILYDAESDDKWELTLDKFLEGIKRQCINRSIALSDLLDNHDACDADCIVQYAIFNELVFG